MSSRRNQSAEDDETTTTSGGSGSNHGNNIGTAVTGAMQKLSSPISGTFRKVSKLDKNNTNPSNHSSAGGNHNGRSTPRSNTRKKKSFGSSDDVPLLGGVEKGAKEVANFFGGAGKGVKQLVTRNSKGGDSSSSRHSDDDGEDDHDDDDLDQAMPPDDTLQKMNIIINKRLKGLSIPRFYETVWSEDKSSGDDDKELLYRSFLEESGKEDIVVGDWETAEAGNDFVGEWDGEKYTQKRTVTFVFDKKIPMQSKPVVATVKQTHYCRVEGNDKCVVAMNIDMKGVPFSDCFNVEIRWVATKSGKDNVAIQVGLFVNFVKSTMLAGKIRSGTTEQTSQQQLQLFGKVQEACGAAVEEVPEEEAPSPAKTDVKLTQDEAGRVIVLSGCCLLFVSQATSLFIRSSSGNTFQTPTSSAGVISVVAGLILLVPTVCQLREEQYLLVVVAHFAQLLPSSLSGLLSVLNTLLLLAAWAVLAWGVWQRRERTSASAGEVPQIKSNN